MNRLTRFYLIMIGLFAWAGLSAQTSFYAVTNAREVVVNSYFQVDFVIENGEPDDFTPPAFTGFSIISGPNRSSQISIINGKRSQKESLGYTLMAVKPGNFSIGPANLKIGNKRYATKPIQIKVLKSSKGSGQLSMDKEVFVRAELSGDRAYVGQQVLLQYVLYTRKRVEGYNILSLPEFNGFLVQETNLTQPSGRKVIDGLEYSTEVLKAFAIFPRKEGILEIPPMQMTLGLATGGSAFGFFRESKPFPIATNDLKLEVSSLPDNAPDSFTGGVGKYTITTEISPKTLTTDDAVSLQLTISGDSPAKFIVAPKPAFPEQFEVYDPTVLSEQDFAENGFILGSRTFEYLLVPLQTGKKKIQLEYSYFDTGSGKYVTLKSPEETIQVSQGKRSVAENQNALTDKMKLSPMKNGSELRNTDNNFIGSVLYWIIMGLMLSVIPLLFWFKKRVEKIKRTDPALLKSQKASKEAKKRLNTARGNLNKKDHPAFYKSVSEALLSYVSDKFYIQTFDLSKANIANALREKSVPELLCQEYTAILENCEMALFAGIPKDGDEALYLEAVNLITELENYITGQK